MSIQSFLRIGATTLLALILSAAAMAAPPASELTLQSAITQAIAASPKLAGSRHGADAAAGTERQAGALPNPELSVEAENFAGSRGYENFDNAEMTYSASQLIELGGKRSARVASAQAERQAAQANIEITRIDLIRDVTDAYMAAVAAEESLALARDLEAAARKVAADVSRRVRAARDPLFQEARADVALTNATIARQAAEATVAQARAKLGRYLGLPTTVAMLATKSFYDAAAPDALATYEARLARAPEQQRLAHLRNAREADISLARARAVPDVRASLGVRQFSGGDETALVAGLSIPIPVFDQNQGDILRAGAEANRALSESQQSELERAQQLNNSWSDWQTASTEIAALKDKALPQAERAFTLALSGYRRGGFQYLDVLDAQRAFYETRAALIAALTRLHEAKAETERLTSPSTTTVAEEKL